MNRRTAFGECHPIVQMLYWMLIILTTVFVNHPVFLMISFLGAVSFRIFLQGISYVVGTYMVKWFPMFLLVACINPAFNHYGVTPLFMLKTGAVTLEAVVYGFVLAAILYISVIWFGNFHDIMTTDRFVYLFSRLSPTISLVLSMALRFVPRFGRQLRKIRMGQRCIGRDMEGKSLVGKMRMGIKEISMLVTWGLESGIDTADSMRARGYGTAKRTSFSVFRWTRRDAVLLLVLGFCYGTVLWGIWKGYTYALYNPVIQIAGVPLSIGSILCFTAWIVCCMLPVLLECLYHYSSEWRIS